MDIRTTHNGVVTADGARGGGERVGGTEDGCDMLVNFSGQSIDGEHTTTGLDGVAALPDHGDDGAAQHVCVKLAIGFVRHQIVAVVERLTGNETGEERLLGEILIVLLEELTRRRDQLQSSELEAID